MDKALSEFSRKLHRKEIRVAVVGLGYVGLPLALAFARKGLRVSGIEIDKGRIEHLRRKESYITDVSNSELRRLLSSGRFRAFSNFNVLKESDVILICVPTPLKRKYHPDISYIRQAVKSISGNLKKGALIILESTTYPGTTEEEILPLLESRGLKHNRDFFLCFSPERIDPGNSSYPVEKIPKVIGGITKEATSLGAVFYKSAINKVVPVSSSRTAETAKLLENTFRLVNIGLIDELARMAHAMGIDIWEVIDAAKTKPFGFMPFYPGPGVGGHCIPKDPLYLYWKARHHGFRSRFIKLASETISSMPEYITERLFSLLKKSGVDPKGAKVLILGAAYKKDIKDLRKSPSIDLIEILHKKGVRVSYHDPLIPYLRLDHINLLCAKMEKGSLKKFDCVLVATDHTAVDYASVLKNAKLIFDCRNVYKGAKERKVERL